MTKGELIAELMASPHADSDPVEIAVTRNGDVSWYSIGEISHWVEKDGTVPHGAPLLVYLGEMVMG